MLKLPSKDQILSDATALPSPPGIVLDLLRLLNDEEVSVTEVAAVVAKDAALAAGLLKSANAASNGLTTRVTRIDRAISTVGLRSFRSLLAKSSMRRLVPDVPGVGSEIRRRSIVNATLARAFANELDENLAEEAFLVGLLGSLGHLVLARVAGDVHGALSERCDGWPRPEAEHELLGFTLDEVNAELMASWSMPDSISEAVYLRGPHAKALTPRYADAGLVAALRLAQRGEHVLCGRTPAPDLRALLDEARAETSLDLLRLSEILVETEPLVIELARELYFDAPDVGSHQERLAVALDSISAEDAPA